MGTLSCLARTWASATPSPLRQRREIARRAVASLSLKPFTGPLRIGHHSELAPDCHFDGQVDDVRVFQRALTPDEVRASFEADH